MHQVAIIMLTGQADDKSVTYAGQKMLNSLVKIAFLVVLSSCLLLACAQVKETGTTIGHATRDAATAIGHGTRDAAKAVGQGVKKVFKSAPENE